MDNDKKTMVAMLQLLRKYNFKNTEDLFRKEANLSDVQLEESQQTDSEVSNVLSAYKSEGDPALYEKSYSELKQFVEGSLDIYKHELGTILYPVLVNMYLELVYNNHSIQAKEILEKYSENLEDYYQADLKRLSNVTKREQMDGNELIDTFKSNQFIIRMSRDTLSMLKRHLQEKKCNSLLNIINERLYFDMYEGVARNKQQIEATSGAILGEATRQDNKAKVYYGLLKEPEIQCVNPPEEEEEDTGGGEGDKPKKKKPKKDPLFSKKTKSDPNAPPVGRMPLPNLKDADKMEKIKALREATKRVQLGPDCLPSICFYTLLNVVHSITAVEISEDSSLLGVGFSDSVIKVWSLLPQKLKVMKNSEQLAEIVTEADDVLVRMMDERTSESVKLLYGHSGPVNCLSFSPDKNLLLSCSEDTTVRLWSLHTWTCVVCYKGHLFPVWYVKFSPHGHYFATASHDKTARLWASDSPQPLRIFAGHFSDVDVVQFHPNSNYIATGSSDMTVRLWDCVTGSQVRLMTGHKAPIYAFAFSIEGRFLASAGADHRVLVWDLAHGHLVAALSGHTSIIHCLSFSRDGTLLVSGGLDCTIKLWDFTKLAEEMSLEDVNVSHNPDVKTNADSYLLRTFATKNSSIFALHFTRRNLLYGVGMFES
ncbi:transcription initiation factor TFIID subunit 5 [Leptopilina boulardi]|uniref:transcription initiation factor TFIID subunit 5 n=1 Tax=Leptopilina boulardi TaxID=63433 RepID=UPI0021F554DE|nr:transcription initiation factor TFIID subunit 5 [Leptopilina boulardi]